MAVEQFAIGANVHLAPACNLHRVPQNGRNFEYFSEDPVLASELAAAETRGIQSVPGMMATIKHFVANNQETQRGSMSSNVPDRAMRELYLRPFVAAVDAGVGAAMCSYNRINGT